MKTVLEVNRIHKAFGSANILNGISFRMYEGERICLLGPSGCGKSTLLQIIAGLLQSDDGEIIVDGDIVSAPGRFVPPEGRPMNMVFQDYALWPHMNVRENMEYGLKRRKVPTAQRHERIASLTRLLKLDGLLNRVPAELSGGQQQRVGIARALATQPKLLLMDEPLSNLDVKLRAEMRSELAAMLASLSITAIYVTHDMMEAFALADRILVLHGGVIEQLAPPRELYESPATPWVAELMGYHTRIQGRVVAIDEGEATIQCGDQRIRGQLSTDTAHRPRLHEAADIMLHMDTLELTSEDREVSDADNRLQATIQRAIYEGERWRCTLQTVDGQVLQAMSKQEPHLGASLLVSFPQHRTRVYAATKLEHSASEAG